MLMLHNSCRNASRFSMTCRDQQPVFRYAPSLAQGLARVCLRLQ